MVGSPNQESMRFAYLLTVTTLLSLAACKHPPAQPPLFTRIAAEASGVAFNNEIARFEGDSLNANTYDPLYNGAGVGVGDFDRDGRLDLFFAGNNVSCRLYLNKTGRRGEPERSEPAEPGAFRFEDVTDRAGVRTRAWCTGVSVADVNQDGWPDIYVSVAGPDTARALRHNLLFINQTKTPGQVPTFREMAADYGLADSGMNTQAAFFDYDRDGDLDCYVLNNAFERTGRNSIRPKRLDGSGPSTDRLYRNDGLNGQPHYVDVSHPAGILAEGYGLGLAVADINQDGWPDVYCANDFLSNDVAYINTGRGGFTDQARTYFRHTSYNSMGVDVQDINNDARPDILVVDMLPETAERQKMMLIKTNWDFFHLARQQGYQDQYVRNTLQLNMGPTPGGSPAFSDVGQLAGISKTDWSWAPLMQDFDNDGLKDVVITNGYRRDITNLDYVVYLNQQASSYGVQPGASRKQSLDELYKLPEVKLHNYAYRNRGAGPAVPPTFEDVSERWGLGDPTYSNGAAYADLDNDGDLDLVFNNIDEEAGLYRNETIAPGKPTTRHYVRLQLPADARGLGATVRLTTADGTVQTVAAHPVRGYASSVEPFVHVGLGKHTTATADVIWADGTRQALGTLAADRLHVVTYRPGNASSNVVTAPAPTTLFTTLPADGVGLTARHAETPGNEFQQTPLLPQLYGRNGPAVAIADADGNGLDDVFVGADPGRMRSLFLQQAPGRFTELVQGATDAEDMGALFFDADGDGDQDLYVVSGGSAQPDGHATYQDRLYLNDGRGKLTRAQGALPATRSSGSCVVAADLDGDGDLDLFRGGRVRVGQYPLAPTSYVLRNDTPRSGAAGQGVSFTDVTDMVAPGLRTTGMVCAALWTDADNDNRPDLLLAGEFMAPTLWRNQNGRLQATATQLPTGLWNSITGADFDRDGDIDYVVGNAGLNTRYRVSAQEPLRIYAKDFDGNGQIDPLVTHYLQGTEYLAPIRDQLNDQMPTLARKRFTTYRQYADMPFADAFDADDLTDARVLAATELRSGYLENRGGGRLVFRPLPLLAQVAPVFGMQTADVNADGLPDLLLVGNSYAPETYSGWHDAGRGCVLLGNGRGGFRPVPPDQTGLHTDGDAKALAALRVGPARWYVVTNNNGPVQLLKPTRPLRTDPPDPRRPYWQVRHPDGRTERRELYYGAGYLSQSSK